MKLSYRGTGYGSDSPHLELGDGDLTGKEGQLWELHYPRHIPTAQTASTLKYRGVSYCTDGAQTGTTAAPSDAAAALTDPLSTAQVRRNSLLLWAETHRANLYRRIQHRLEVAKAKGDQHLIRLLEQELQEIV